MNTFNILLFICQLYLHKTEIKKKKEYENTNIDFWLLNWTERNLGSLEKRNDNDNDVNYDDLYITSSSYSLRPVDISEVSPVLRLRKLRIGRAKWHVESKNK